MKKHCVYELINSLGTVEYVGCTHQPKVRFIDHTKKKPDNNHGKFYGRQDLTMHIVKQFSIRKEAHLYEGELKLSHGMEWTEKTTGVKCGKTGLGAKAMKEKYSQPITAWDYITGEFIGKWDSMIETANVLTELKGFKIRQGNISNVLSGKRNHTAGITFKRI